MASMATRHIANIVHASHLKSSPSAFAKPKPPTFVTATDIARFLNPLEFSRKHNLAAVSKASSTDSISPVDNEDGVSLGTMKLPSNIDVPRFETLLFQWGNSLCQGANLPLPLPLKVDKIPGGARLGFITIGDAETETLVYIDCLVFPGTDSSVPVFRAIRNGRRKVQPAPGEERIMRGLLEALKKCVEIARL